MANQGKRMVPEDELKYLETVIENNPDPTDIGGGTEYTAGTGIDITENEISIDDTVALKSELPNEVTGTNDGTNWTSLTVGSDTYSIPSGSGEYALELSTTSSNIFGTLTEEEYAKIGLGSKIKVTLSKGTANEVVSEFTIVRNANGYWYGLGGSEGITNFSRAAYSNATMFNLNTNYFFINPFRSYFILNTYDRPLFGVYTNNSQIIKLDNTNCFICDIPPCPNGTAGTFTLQCVVDSDGNRTYSWI